MKNPIDDMCLSDLRPMPDFERLQGIMLNGEAYANCLMVVEFCHNFKEALNFGWFLYWYDLKFINFIFLKISVSFSDFVIPNILNLLV